MRLTYPHLAILLALVSFTLLSMSGCTANPPSVKSSAGKEIKPITGNTAAQRGETLATANSGPSVGKRDTKLEVIALFDDKAMPTGVTVSQEGRIFLSFPRWGDPVKYTAVELAGDRLMPFPDADTNAFDATKLEEFNPRNHLVSVQSVVVDSRDRLWLLDPGGIGLGPNIKDGPKLWGYDLATGQRVKSISFPQDVAMKNTYLNDVRFDLNRGSEGTAYITDSGVGGIIVVDLASGTSWRRLDQHPSVLPTSGLVLQSEGEPFMERKPNGEVAAPDIRSDGIALSPDGQTLYYTAIVSHDIYSVPTELLANRNADPKEVAAAMKKVATKPSGNDGIICDSQGRIYTTDFEDNSIRWVDPTTGKIGILVQDERLLWPDTLAIHDGYLYITSNQLARQPKYHFGKDLRKPPYALFRYPIQETSGTANSR